MSARYALRPAAVAWSGIGAEIVLLDLGTSTYLAVTTGAAALWTRLADSPASREELAGVLTSTFGINADIAAEDCREFLDDLVARGFVETITTAEPQL